LKLLTLAVIALAVMLTACTATPSSDPSGGDLSTTKIEVYSFQRTLPLPVSTPPGDILYRNPMLAIELLGVLADDRRLAAKPAIVPIAGVDASTVTVQSAKHFYNVDLRRPHLSILAGSPDLKFVVYLISEDTDVLVIRYRLVPYDSNPDPRIYTLTARRIG